MPTVSARERGMPRREIVGNESEEEEEGVWVRERRSKARSLTWVLYSGFCIFFSVLLQSELGVLLLLVLFLSVSASLVVNGDDLGKITLEWLRLEMVAR